MNIQQYNISPELVTSLVVVASMLLVYCIFRLTGRLHNTREQEHYRPTEQDTAPDVRAGQLWFTRTGQYEPFVNTEVEPIEILEYRTNGFDGWVRYEMEGKRVIQRFSEFVVMHMLDEFDDLAPEPMPIEEVQPELDLEVEFEEPAAPTIPSKNVVNIDGKEFVLTPV